MSECACIICTALSRTSGEMVSLVGQDDAGLVDTMRELDTPADGLFTATIRHDFTSEDCVIFFGVSKSTIDNTVAEALAKIRSNPEHLDALREYLSNNCGMFSAMWE